MKTFNTQVAFLLVLLLLLTMFLSAAVPVFAQRGNWNGKNRSDSERTPPPVFQRPQQPAQPSKPLVFQRPSADSSPSPKPAPALPVTQVPERQPVQQPSAQPQSTRPPQLPNGGFVRRFAPQPSTEKTDRRPAGYAVSTMDTTQMDPAQIPEKLRSDIRDDKPADRQRPDIRPRPDQPRPDIRPRPDRLGPDRPDNHSYKPAYRPPRQTAPPPVVVDRYRKNFSGYNSYWTPDWYHRHPALWNPAYISYQNWWLRPSWNTTWGWFTPGFFTGTAAGNVINPYYYNYGSNIIYSGGMVYVNGVPYVSASEYYRQALELANTNPNINAYIVQPEPVVIEKEVPVIVEKVVEKEVPVLAKKEVAAEPAPELIVPAKESTDKSADKSTDKSSEWLPMGTFAFADENSPESSPDKSRVIQLASDKKGNIRGNYIDEAKNETRQLTGAVDPKTQRVALKFTDDDKTVMECGLWNLTQDSVPLLVHKNETETESSTLIRLTPPEAEKNPVIPAEPAVMETEEELAP